MSRSGSGRFRQFQRVTRLRPPRAPQAVFASTCITESWDGGSWPLGPDLTWQEGHFAQAGFGESIDTDGSNALQRTLHVVDNALTIQAPDDSELPGSNGWFRTQGYARADSELPGSDMQVTATIGGVTAGNGTPEWILIVRTSPHANENFTTGFIQGWVVYFNAPDYVFLDLIYDDGVLLNSGFTDTATVNPSFSWTAQEGDQIRVTVTGTGNDTVLVAEAPIGNIAMTLNLANDWGDALQPGDNSGMFPTGTQAGAGLFVQSTDPSEPISAWNHAAWDDVLTLDDWEACSV